MAPKIKGSGPIMCEYEGCPPRRAAVKVGRIPFCAKCFPKALAERKRVSVTPIRDAPDAQAVMKAFMETMR